MKIRFIAEIGMNHNGNLDLIYELIRQSKYAGADVAKFQLGWRAKEGEINCISIERLQQIKQWCEYFEIDFMASIITREAYEMAEKVGMASYKVASRTVKDDFLLVQQMVATGKETIISLGMWDRSEPPLPKRSNIKYLWCKSKYPCTPWDMVNFPKSFSNTIYDGYSDHTIGIDMPLIAIARGASIIEKHFTLDKSDTSIRDHALSATPSEFSQLVQIGSEIYKKLALGV
jgi:sialic acid synthase SpsE